MRAVALLAILGLAACTPGACDPGQAGFLSGIGCEASGSYATRNAYQQSQLAATNGQALQNRSAALYERDRANNALLSRDQARTRLAQVDNQTGQLRARLADARTRTGVDQARLGALQAEVAALQARRGTLDPAALTPTQLQAYEERQRRLMEQIQGL